jgi:hypothetical protein
VVTIDIVGQMIFSCSRSIKRVYRFDVVLYRHIGILASKTFVGPLETTKRRKLNRQHYTKIALLGFHVFLDINHSRNSQSKALYWNSLAPPNLWNAIVCIHRSWDIGLPGFVQFIYWLSISSKSDGWHHWCERLVVVRLSIINILIAVGAELRIGQDEILKTPHMVCATSQTEYLYCECQLLITELSGVRIWSWYWPRITKSVAMASHDVSAGGPVLIARSIMIPCRIWQCNMIGVVWNVYNE